MMNNLLVEYERRAFEARSKRDFLSAISLYEKIVNENPNWEHGEAYYNLASCYWEIGELAKAEENYLLALKIQPKYYIFVGTYASFLSQHGKPQSAFDWYLRLLKIEMESRPLAWDAEYQQQLDNSEATLFELGEKMGWNRDDVEERINGI